MTQIRSVIGIAAIAAALAGCAVSQVHLDPEFGQAFRESTLAQVADPDARYSGTPAPGSSGARVGLAQERYRTGTVIQPAPATTTLIGSANQGAGGQ